MKLLTPMHANTKTSKNSGKGYLTAILHLASHTLSGYNVCPRASAGCASSCLNTAGQGRFQNVQDARIRKTQWYVNKRVEFLEQLHEDIEALVRKAKREGLTPVVRLNGTSDLNWAPTISYFPAVQFYDYTKVFSRLTLLRDNQARNRLLNYHLTFSASEINQDEVARALMLGFNVATVFHGEMPIEYAGRAVISGDDHDLRFLDPSVKPGLIVGLIVKGQAKKDQSGFAVKAKSL